MDLYIGNKNYSTWSMRAWLVLQHFQIPFTEHLVPFDDFLPEQNFKQTLAKITPVGKVPVLKHQDLIVWESLAICEYLAELFPERHRWVQDVKTRAYARAICAEMHSGFMALRSLCPMNVTQDFIQLGQQLFHENVDLQADIKRVEEIWSKRENPKGFLCGNEFTIADAFYAPVVMRFKSYGLLVSESSQQYMQTILNLEAMKAWIEAAQQEN